MAATTGVLSKAVAQTGDASDHPLLITNGPHAFLSWLTRREGYG